MTHPPYGNPPNAGPPPGPPPESPYGPPPQPAKKRNLWKIVVILVGIIPLICLGLAIAGVFASKNAPTGNRTISTATATPPATAGVGAVPATTKPAAAEPASGTPKASDFKMNPKILSKHCFGSAGCNITFRVDVTYSGPALSDSDTWLITYEVSGVEDGPMVDSIELTGTQFEGSEQTASTSSSASKLKAKVTEIVKK